MDQNSGTGGMGNNQGNEDASAAREHVHAAEENRDALEAQNRRTEATTDGSVDTPIGAGNGMNATGGGQSGMNTSGGGQGGMNAAGTTRASDDPGQARAHVRNAEENRDALAEESRRVEASAPDNIDTGRR